MGQDGVHFYTFFLIMWQQQRHTDTDTEEKESGNRNGVAYWHPSVEIKKTRRRDVGRTQAG